MIWLRLLDIRISLAVAVAVAVRGPRVHIALIRCLAPPDSEGGWAGFTVGGVRNELDTVGQAANVVGLVKELGIFGVLLPLQAERALDLLRGHLLQCVGDRAPGRILLPWGFLGRLLVLAAKRPPPLP